MNTSGPPEAVRDPADSLVPSDSFVPDPRAAFADPVPSPRPSPNGFVAAQGVPALGPAAQAVPALAPAASAAGPSAASASASASSAAPPAVPSVSAVQIVDPPPRRWGLGAYLLAEAVFLLSSVALALPYIGDGKPTPSPAVILLSLLVPTVLAAAVALVATVLRGNGPRLDLGLRFERADLTRGLAFGVCGLALSIPAGALWSKAVGPDEANSAVGELFAGQRFAVPLAIAAFLVMWLVAPICEEIVYRGLLWGAVERLGAVRWWAFGITTLCFALVHFEFTRTPLLLVIAVPIGLARLYTGRLGASIVAHQVNNFLPALWLMLTVLGVSPG